MPRAPKERSFASMLRIAINEAVEDGGPKKLRLVADALVARGLSGDVAALKEIADRLDGKVPQAIVGDDDEAPIRFDRIELVAPNDDSSSQASS